MEKALAEVIARLKRIMDAQSEIEREANLNNEGVFSDQQRGEYEALDAQFKELETQKENLEKQMELVNSRSERAEALKPRLVATRRTAPNSGAQHVISDIPEGEPIEREATNNRPSRIEFTIPRNVQRIKPANFKGEKDGMTAEERAFRFGMWALATLTRCIPGRYQFNNAVKFVENYMRITNTAHGESDGTTGGHVLVPDEFSSDLIDLRELYGVVRRLFERVPMSSDVLNRPKNSGGLTAYFTGESSAATESNMTWENVQLVAKKLTAMSRMSNELSADAVISVGDTLAFEIGQAFALKEDHCGFNGDGTGTYGGINGVRNRLTSVDGAGTDAAGLVVQGSGNTWGAFTIGDLLGVIAKLPDFADMNASFVCHRAFYFGVMRPLEIAAGGTPASEVAAGERANFRFQGYPVVFSQVFPSTTATATVALAFGSFSQGAMLGDRQQTSIMFSEHATIGGENVFERGQIAVRGDERIDINVHGCGTASVVGPIVGLRTGN